MIKNYQINTVFQLLIKNLSQEYIQLDNSGVFVTNNILSPAVILGSISLKFIHKFHSVISCPGLQHLVENYNILSGMEETNNFWSHYHAN